MITIICATFLRYKGKIDTEIFMILCLCGGLSELLIELLALCVVVG